MAWTQLATSSSDSHWISMRLSLPSFSPPPVRMWSQRKTPGSSPEGSALEAFPAPLSSSPSYHSSTPFEKSLTRRSCHDMPMNPPFLWSVASRTSSTAASPAAAPAARTSSSASAMRSSAPSPYTYWFMALRRFPEHSDLSTLRSERPSTRRNASAMRAARARSARPRMRERAPSSVPSPSHAFLMRCARSTSGGSRSAKSAARASPEKAFLMCFLSGVSVAWKYACLSAGICFADCATMRLMMASFASSSPSSSKPWSSTACSSARARSIPDPPSGFGRLRMAMSTLQKSPDTSSFTWRTSDLP
mmetsp:Transcript_10755/g.35303  ORF Transcript_10755/g.35303 Transcript_10755/m.35303 type:complete len:305 (-) Transcript_10755:2045-2959(-)